MTSFLAPAGILFLVFSSEGFSGDFSPPVPPVNCCGYSHCVKLEDLDVTTFRALTGDLDSLRAMDLTEDLCGATLYQNWGVLAGVLGSELDAANAAVVADSNLFAMDRDEIRMMFLFRAANLGGAAAMEELAEEMLRKGSAIFDAASRYWRLRSSLCGVRQHEARTVPACNQEEELRELIWSEFLKESVTE